MWFSIPFTLATSLGLAAVALDLPLTAGEAGDGLVPPAVAYYVLGKAGAVWLVRLFSCFPPHRMPQWSHCWPAPRSCTSLPAAVAHGWLLEGLFSCAHLRITTMHGLSRPLACEA
jgi:hypothetical protein